MEDSHVAEVVATWCAYIIGGAFMLYAVLLSALQFLQAISTWNQGPPALQHTIRVTGIGSQQQRATNTPQPDEEPRT